MHQCKLEVATGLIAGRLGLQGGFCLVLIMGFARPSWQSWCLGLEPVAANGLNVLTASIAGGTPMEVAYYSMFKRQKEHCLRANEC